MQDVLIIGGGIAGISAAARLSKNFSTTVLEAEPSLAYHASGRSAAAFIEDYGNDTVRELNRDSTEFLHLNDSRVLSSRGLLLIADKRQKSEFKKERKSFGLVSITRKEAHSKLPIIDIEKIKFAAYREDVFDLDTDLFFQNFLSETRKNGAKIITNSKVNNIESLSCGWNVITTEREFKAKILINAAGPWADEIANLAKVKPIGFIPFKRSIAKIPIGEQSNIGGWPFLFGVNESWYAKPDAGQLLVSPSEEEPCEPHDAWADDLTVAEGISRFEEYVKIRVKRISAKWAGLRTFSPDRSLVIGFDPAKKNFFWLAGQGGYGFQTAASASELVKDLISNNPPKLSPQAIKNLSPIRFSKI